jgi:hypothetical protein
MSVAQEFRARAAYCKERAAETSDPSLKREYEMIAQKRINLAEDREAPARRSSTGSAWADGTLIG